MDARLDDLQYLIQQLDWFREEVQNFSERIQEVAKHLITEADTARAQWAYSEAQRYMRVAEDVIDRLHQATTGDYWNK